MCRKCHYLEVRDIELCSFGFVVVKYLNVGCLVLNVECWLYIYLCMGWS